MGRVRSEDQLEVLACEIEARPSAPTILQVAALASSVTRDPDALIVRFPAETRDMVEEFAAAEEQCCRRIGWKFTDRPDISLRITANGAALDVLESIWKTINIENSQ